MSLLNDALKAAEKRQGQARVPHAYVGRASGTSRRRSMLMPLFLVMVTLAGIGGGYLYLGAGDGATAPRLTDEDNSPSAPAVADEGLAEAESAQEVESPATGRVPPGVVSEPAKTDGETARGRQPDMADTGTIQTPVLAAEQKKPLAAGQSAGGEAGKTGESGRSEKASLASRDASASTPAPGKPEPVVVEKEAVAPAAVADIKRPLQTPEQVDRDTRRRLEALLSRGEITEAERVLDEVTANQDAPGSRYAVARWLLARGYVEQALSWVPARLAHSYPELRLIRARAQLSNGDLDGAVATLSTRVPPVAEQVEYRVTLATLLQQQGQSETAARHWAELIAWDDSQAPWWVGLGIALEGRGDVKAARRAYQQAAALPGLAPSLANYVRQRLQSLNAG